MSCYLNINLSKFNPEKKFKFPWEKIKQSDYRNYEDYGLSAILQHPLFCNFNVFTKLQCEKTRCIYFIPDNGKRLNIEAVDLNLVRSSI